MKIVISLLADSDNTYLANCEGVSLQLVHFSSDKDEIMISLQNPSRVIRVGKDELLKALSIL